MWKPCISTDVSKPKGGKKTTTPAHKETKKKGKEKEKQTDTGVEQPLVKSEVRTVWIRVHPAVFDEVFSGLQASASLVLKNIRQPPGTTAMPNTEIEIADLRDHVNVFEIMGPKSSQVLKGALTPVGEDKREEFKKV